MKTTVWDFFAPVYERSMHSQKGIYDYMYNRISQVVAEKEVLELATGPGMIAKHIAASAKNVIASKVTCTRHIMITVNRKLL